MGPKLYRYVFLMRLFDFSFSVIRVSSVFIFISRSETLTFMELTVFFISSRFCSFIFTFFISSSSSCVHGGGVGKADTQKHYN